jgi:hypothetical protein
LIGVTGVLFYPFALSEPGTIVEARYMSYACGECFVQNKILHVMEPQGRAPLREMPADTSDSPTKFIGWDFVVIYKDDDAALSTYFGKVSSAGRNGDCALPTFRLVGQLKRKLIYSLIYRGDHYDGIYFDAKSVVALGHSTPLCEQPKESPL